MRNSGDIVRVCVLDQEQYSSGDFLFDGKLDDVIASLQKIRDKIPEEYRAVADCDIDTSSGYEGSYYAHIEVNYWRPQTEAEIAERQRGREEAAATRRAAARAEYERLRKMFE